MRVETLDPHLVTLTSAIEALTEQVGRLTESIFETQNLLRESGNRRDAQIDAQNRIADTQASNIAALTRLVELLVSRN